MQVYAPTTDPNLEDVEQFYADLQQGFDQAPAKDIIFIAGDFNAKVGAGNEIPVVGKFGLGERCWRVRCRRILMDLSDLLHNCPS